MPEDKSHVGEPDRSKRFAARESTPMELRPAETAGRLKQQSGRSLNQRVRLPIRRSCPK